MEKIPRNDPKNAKAEKNFFAYLGSFLVNYLATSLPKMVLKTQQ